MAELQWTGERCIPELMNQGNSPEHQKHLDSVLIQHLARYEFAKPYCKDKKVLDAACGSGYGSKSMAEVASYVTGIDVDLDTIKYCKDKRATKNTDFLLYNLECNFPDDDYDIVVSFETIEHLEAPGNFLVQTSRRCKDTFIFSIPLNNPSEFHKQVYTLFAAKEMMLAYFPPEEWQMTWFEQEMDKIVPLEKENRFLIGVAKKIIK